MTAAQPKPEILFLLKRFDDVRTPCLALPFLADEKPLKGLCGMADWRMNGALSRQLQANHIQGEPGETVLIPTLGRLPIENYLMLGLGKREFVTADRYAEILTKLSTVARKAKLNDFVLALNACVPTLDQAVWLAEFVRKNAVGMELMRWSVLVDSKSALTELKPLTERFAKTLAVQVADSSHVPGQARPFAHSP